MSSQTVLAAIALVGLIVLSFMFAFHAVPAANHDFMTHALGALSGALTVGGASKVAGRISGAAVRPGAADGERP